MRVFLILLFLFIAVPLVELALLLSVSAHFGWWWQTLILVIVTGVTGAFFAKQQGWQTWERLKQNISDREMPTDALFDGIMILVAGAFLITPGLLTDFAGFSLLFPPFRKLIKTPIIFWLKRTIFFRFQGMNPFPEPGSSPLSDLGSMFGDSEDAPASNEIIDVPFTRKTD